MKLVVFVFVLLVFDVAFAAVMFVVVVAVVVIVIVELFNLFYEFLDWVSNLDLSLLAHTRSVMIVLRRLNYNLVNIPNYNFYIVFLHHVINVNIVLYPS